MIVAVVVRPMVDALAIQALDFDLEPEKLVLVVANKWKDGKFGKKYFFLN